MKFLLRIIIDVLVVILIYAAPWYLGAVAIIALALFFHPYFEIIAFASILDAYYGSPSHYLYSAIAVVYFMIIYFLQDKILLRP